MKLSAESLRYQQGDFAVIADQIFSSGVYLITGGIGSGKSTLSLLLSDYLKPDSGFIRRTDIHSEILSLQFPEYHITGSTVADEIRSWGVKPEVLGRGVISEMIWDQDPFTLSRGELKRLVLACAFVKKPDLLILDEPFSSLDSEMKLWVCEEIKKRTFGITIIFTHEREVLPEAEHHLVMRSGSLYRAEGEIRSIQNEANDPTEEEPDPVIRDGRLRLFAVVCLSLGAFLSLGGAILTLVWWSIALWRRWTIPDKKILITLGMLILLPALVTELLSGGGLSYGIRMGVILFISYWAYTEFRGGEMFDLFVSAFSDQRGFDIGLTAEMTMQSIRLARLDIRQIQKAYAIKEISIGWKTFIPAVITLLLLHINRSEETATLLALRGFRGGGTYDPVFHAGQKDVFLTLIASIPLIFSITLIW